MQHFPILRWVIRYSVDLAEAWLPYERAVGRSWRCDETYIKVGGQWMYLYRAVDACGKTVESHLSRTRDIAAAKAFFRKALKRHGQPRTITLDGFEATHSALRRMGMRILRLAIHSALRRRLARPGPPCRASSRISRASTFPTALRARES